MRIQATGKGLSPQITTATKRAWQCNGSGTLKDAVYPAPKDLPTNTGAIANTTNSPTGLARGFNAINYFLEGVSTQGSDASIFYADYSVDCLFMRSASNAETLFNYGGIAGDGIAAENSLFNVSFLVDGTMRFFWEFGTGTNQLYDTTLKFRAGRWYFTRFIRRGTTLELWVNGRLAESFINTTTAVGGTNARWTIGGRLDGTGSFLGKIAFLNVHNIAISEKQNQDDMKRITLTGFHCKFDAKVEIKDSLGAWVNLSDLEGHDWVEGGRINDGVDALCRTMDLELTREIDRFSLAWLKTDSKINLSDKANLAAYAPLLRAGNSIRASFAKTPLFIAPITSDFQIDFEGEVDEVDAGTSPINIKCRDLGAELSYIQIEVDNQIYPTSNTVTAADVTMQEIITAWVSSNPQVYMPVPSNAVVNPYKLKRGNIHNATRGISTINGWEFKYRWDSFTNTNRLTYFDPDRSRTDVDFFVGADEYKEISNLTQDRTRIRNKIAVRYLDINTPDSQGQPTPNTITVQDTTSQAQYGLQFAEVTEGASKHIDTVAEATDMANAILSDLKDPEAEQSIVLPFQPEIEVYDMGGFQKNNVHYTADQFFGVTSITHTWKAGQGATTAIKTRGKPTTGQKRWFYMFAGILGVPPVPMSAPTDITAFQTIPFEGGLRVEHAFPPKDSFWWETRVFADVNAGFTPSNLNLVGHGKQSKFVIEGLDMGKVHYFKAETVDKRGNSTLIDLGSSTPLYHQINSINPDFSSGNNPTIFNSALSQHGTSQGLNAPPEGWTTGGLGEWNSTISSILGAKSGSRSVAITADTATLISRKFIVKGDQLYEFSVNLNFSVDNSTALGTFYVKWYDEAQVLVGTSGAVSAFGNNGGSFQEESGFITAPTTARYAEIVATRDGSTYAFPWVLYLDSIDLTEHPVSFSFFNNVQTTAIPAAAEFPITYSGSNHLHGQALLFNTALGQFMAPKNGVYSFSARINLTTVSANKTRAALRVNGVVKHTGTWRASVGTGMSAGISVDALYLTRGQVVDTSIYATGACSLAPSTTGFWFTGRAVK